MVAPEQDEISLDQNSGDDDCERSESQSLAMVLRGGINAESTDDSEGKAKWEILRVDGSKATLARPYR
jgi:hypothetical protein